MAQKIRHREQLLMAAGRNEAERRYWSAQFAGFSYPASFPGDGASQGDNLSPAACEEFEILPQLARKLETLARSSPHALHVILTAGVALLLHVYGGKREIEVGTPLYRQEDAGDMVNGILPLRVPAPPGATFKELLLQVRRLVQEGTAHVNYPLEVLIEELDVSTIAGPAGLFDVAVSVAEIHDKDDIVSRASPSMHWNFSCGNNGLRGAVEYDGDLYRRESVLRIAGHFCHVLGQAAADVEARIDAIGLLPAHEKEALARHLNHPLPELEEPLAVNRRFELQVLRTPQAIAVKMGADRLTYEELNIRSNRLAHRLLRRGVRRGDIVGLAMRRSVEMAVGIMGILKSGAAYLPLEPSWPVRRMGSVLDDADVSLVVVDDDTLSGLRISSLMGRKSRSAHPVKTAIRSQITDLDSLPATNRALVDYEAYGRFIGQAMVKHSVTLQATRGCPYKCAYCHRIWPRRHVFRSAEHIFGEVDLYYKMGVRRFSFVDDIFNLNRQNSRRFFQLVIDAGMNEDIRFFFPNGMRGDILTEEDIDLMVEAGTVNLAIALETASPRLQTLIGKELDLEALRRNIHYFCTRHPQVILELFTIHGFPGETEAEALATLEFVKSLKWIHFPYVFVLKIYPNTPMYELAIEQGVSPRAIEESTQLAFHELPDTLPFPRSFTIKYQADFLNTYFLDRERLLHVLPLQMRVLTEDELVQKYDSYLPAKIESLRGLLEFAGIADDDLPALECVAEATVCPEGFNEKLFRRFPIAKSEPDALRVLLLDLSQFFSDRSGDMLYDVVEPPLGLMQLLTYAQRELPGEINGKIAKSRIDFDDYDSLRNMVKDFSPDVIGVRTLTFYKDFFHRAVSSIRQWGFEGAIVAGGPYATSDYTGALNDSNIDVIVPGEGEVTFARLLEAMIANGRRLPGQDVLRTIDGIVFHPGNHSGEPAGREFLVSPLSGHDTYDGCDHNPDVTNAPGDLAYCIFTSGSTGFPKGSLVEHRNLLHLVNGMKRRIYDRIETGVGPLNVGLLSPLVFDASVKQIFPALLLGHTLTILPEEARLDGQLLLETYRKEEIDIADGTPAHLSILVDTPLKGEMALPVKFFLIGGESLPAGLVRRFLSMFGSGGAAVVNVYGPTECSDVTSVHVVDPVEPGNIEHIPIGKILDHVRVVVMGGGGLPLPPGVPGELWISGGGVGRGYLNRPELTGRMFLPFALDGREGEERVFYRSGDRVRLMPGGQLEFLGRIDDQVKIRGYRIEPGEIERIILGFDDIKRAAVVPLQQEGGQLFLCAFATGRDGLDGGELKMRLSRVLPEYLLPHRIVVLDELPLGANGKLDRKRLPELDLTRGLDRTPPRDVLERELALIWAGVLEVEHTLIGIDANFFELGGHSLRAVKLMALAFQKTGVKLSMTEIFNSPTIRRQAEIIRSSAPRKSDSPQPLEKRDYYPLSVNQERIWLAQQLNPRSAAYHISGSIQVGENSRLNVEALDLTLHSIMDRHESFRTGFVDHGSGPVQLVVDRLDAPLRVVDAASLPEAERTAGIVSLRNDLEFTPFDLGRPPLWRMLLIQAPDGDSLLVCIHHIIADGWSLGIVRDEFLRLYTGYASGNAPRLTPLALQYRDYAWWQKRRIEDPALSRQAFDFWKSRYSGNLPRLELPVGGHTQERRDGSSGFCFVVEDPLPKQLENLGVAAGASLFVVLFGVLNLALCRISNQTDFIVGLLGAGRDHEATQQIVGFFVNTLAYRCVVDSSMPFDRYLRQLNGDVLAMAEHQWYPVEKVVEALDIPFPEIRVLFNMFNEDHGDGVEKAGFYRLMDGEVKFPLIFYANRFPGRLAIRCHFRNHLFSRQTIEFLMDHYRRILSGAAADPGKPIKDIMFPNRKKRLTLGGGR